MTSWAVTEDEEEDFTESSKQLSVTLSTGASASAPSEAAPKKLDSGITTVTKKEEQKPKAEPNEPELKREALQPKPAGTVILAMFGLTHCGAQLPHLVQLPWPRHPTLNLEPLMKW